jgi:hypothetical protein
MGEIISHKQSQNNATQPRGLPNSYDAMRQGESATSAGEKFAG